MGACDVRKATLGIVCKLVKSLADPYNGVVAGESSYLPLFSKARRAAMADKSTPRVAASLSARPLLAVQKQPRVPEFTD